MTIDASGKRFDDQLAHIVRMAATVESQPADRDVLALTLAKHIAHLRLGNRVHAQLTLIAALALLTLERHDELQTRALVASHKIHPVEATAMDTPCYGAPGQGAALSAVSA